MRGGCWFIAWCGATGPNCANLGTIRGNIASCLRQEQIRRWEKFALGWQCLPLFHPEEAELAVHQIVHELLSSSNFDLYQPEEITRKLVIAAAKKAYVPWASNEHSKTAKQAAMTSLPWNMPIRFGVRKI